LHCYEIDPGRGLAVPESGGGAKTRRFIEQGVQILHIADWCNACGNCTTFCPTSGAPFEEKPHLYLSREAFEQEREGYFLTAQKGSLMLYKLHDSHAASLERSGGGMTYKNQDREIHFNHPLELNNTGEDIQSNYLKDMEEAVAMSVIMEGAASFYGISSNNG
jgi:putative selenate reductase